MMDAAKYADLFLDESREHLTVINNELLALERDPTAAGAINAIFRAVHNLKGMSATMGFLPVAQLSHAIENLLDLVRASLSAPDPELLQLLFRAIDRIERSIDDIIKRGHTADVDPAVAELDEFAARYRGADDKSGIQRPPLAPEAPVQGTRHVQVQIKRDALLRGARAALVIQRAASLGRVMGVSPPLTSMESDRFDGRFTFGLECDEAPAAIEQVLSRVGDVESVSVLTAQPESGRVSGAARHVRMDLRRLDRIMALVAELTTARARLVRHPVAKSDPDLEDMTRTVSRLVHGLQHEVVQARMAPVAQVFDRFPRGVRDAAREHGKDVTFAIEGREIELDRAILDELSDPLLHLLRNAVDHGIESPAERRAAGKPGTGRITLSAYRERAMVVIQVCDDGRGIDRDRVIAEARKRKITHHDADNPKREELLDLLARPGFSTAEAVSNLSGRGVGIDVVTSRLRSIGGSLDLQTVAGRGSTFTLRLPPTLALLPALVAEVGEERFALPLSHVAETVDLDSQASTRGNGRETLTVRDGTVPLSRLRDLVVAEGPEPAKQPVIILQIGERRAGLVVDRVLGQQDVVVKSFEMPPGTVPYFGGATLLGDGEPALVLDAARLV